MNSSTAQQFSNTAAGQHTEPESQSQPPPQPEDSQSTRLTLQQVNQWSESRVCKWVREQGFTKYEASFRENMINGEALVELDYNLLKDLSVRTVGERVRLNLAIKRLRQQCLQVEADNEATARGKQSMAAEGYASPNSLTPHSGIDISPVSVSALRNSHSAAASAAGTVNANGALMNCGAKDLPQPLRIAHSSAAIGGPASSENGANHNNGSSIIQRANTDTRSFSTREHINNQHHPSQTIGGVALRRPKTPHDKASNLVQPLTMSPLVSMNMLKQGSKTGSAKENGHLSQSSKLSLKTNPGALSGMLGVEPMSAPLPRMRMISNTFRQLSTSASPPPSTPLQALRDAVESKSSSKYGSGEDADRLGLQFQEFFGTEINVANLADSLTVKTWQVTISGPDNQVHQVTISMGSSAATILDKVRDEFDLNNDSDGEQYSLFSMTSEGGGARCLSNDELTKLFADPEGSPPQKFFLRKRHQLSRPLMNSNRSEHLQRAIERLGNTLPASQQQQTQRAASKWDNTTEKLTKILGERPPSELVSMNVEKYFPGNEARARHSIMRRKRHESQESVGFEDVDFSKRRSKRVSNSQRRSSTMSSTSSRIMRDRLKSLTIGSDKSWSQFSSSLEPIKESQASPIISSEQAASSLAEAIVRDADSSISQEPSEQGRSQLLQYSPLPALPESLPSSPIAESDPADASDVLFATADAQADDAAPPDAPTVPTVVAAAEATPQPIATSKQSKRKSTLYIENRPTLIRSRSCESLQYSDEGSTGTLSDLSSSSQMSDSVDSDDSSFYESLADSDIDGDENLADDDSDARTSNPATGRLSEEEEGKNGYFAEGDVLQGTFGNAVGRQAAGIVAEDANGGEHRHSVTRSTSTASRTAWAHLKKKTWIKGAPIASGSFGSVYFGMNTRTGVIMAVKEVELPKPGTVSMNRNQKMADALRHELDLLKGLDHKNVVKYLGTDMDDRNLFIFLEYVSGGSVSSALASFGMFPESLVRTYTGQILEGLVYLHDQGIIHRDIKGGNVLIDQDGSVKISDFGISKRVDEVVASSKKDRRASLQGSVFWMAPEVVKDTKYTIKGDVWSLGCLVIEMITGAHPFPELDQMQALFSIGQRGRPKIPDGMSVAGQQFLDEALQVDLEKRPTAKDLVPHPFVYDTEPPSP